MCVVTFSHSPPHPVELISECSGNALWASGTWTSYHNGLAKKKKKSKETNKRDTTTVLCEVWMDEGKELWGSWCLVQVLSRFIEPRDGCTSLSCDMMRQHVETSSSKPVQRTWTYKIRGREDNLVLGGQWIHQVLQVPNTYAIWFHSQVAKHRLKNPLMHITENLYYSLPT